MVGIVEIPVFCDREVHVQGCCMAAPDQIGQRSDPLLDDQELMLRQPTAQEVLELLRKQYTALHDGGEIADTTFHKLCWFADRYVPLIDAEWWDDRSLEWGEDET